MSKYYYGMRLRGCSPGCQPKKGLADVIFGETVKQDSLRQYYDILVYNRELTEQELGEYELDFIREEE